jgi:CO dehydrogenase maturation factor
MNTKKISVCGKVGSGKSSVVSLLANGMRERGYRVLVVDSDESEPSNNILTQEEIRIADLRPQYIVETDAIGTVFIRKTFQPLEGCACRRMRWRLLIWRQA